MSRTVRTTTWPDREIEIDDREYLDLSRRGMILADVSRVPPVETTPVEEVPPHLSRRRKTAPDSE